LEDGTRTLVLPTCVIASDSEERGGRLSEHSLAGKDGAQRRYIVGRENRVQVALVKDGYDGAPAMLEETGQGLADFRLDQLSMMQP